MIKTLKLVHNRVLICFVRSNIIPVGLNAHSANFFTFVRHWRSWSRSWAWSFTLTEGFRRPFFAWKLSSFNIFYFIEIWLLHTRRTWFTQFLLFFIFCTSWSNLRCIWRSSIVILVLPLVKTTFTKNNNLLII